MSDINVQSEDLSARMQMNLEQSTISFAHASEAVALCLIRKKTWGGLGGYVYFLEKRKKKPGKRTPGKYTLYGGGIEYTNALKFEDSASQSALAREIEEELGLQYGPGRYDFMLSTLGGREVGDIIATDVFVMHDDAARRVTSRAIRRHQSRSRESLENIKAGASSPSDEQELQKLESAVSAGSPKKIRDWSSAIFPLRLFPKPDFSRLSPLAAYAVLMDIRSRQTARESLKGK